MGKEVVGSSPTAASQPGRGHFGDRAPPIKQSRNLRPRAFKGQTGHRQGCSKVWAAPWATDLAAIWRSRFTYITEWGLLPHGREVKPMQWLIEVRTDDGVVIHTETLVGSMTDAEDRAVIVAMTTTERTDVTLVGL